MSTLIIIDMQPEFGASQNPIVLRNVYREIRAAKKRNAGILVVEFVGVGKTDKRIMDKLHGYGRWRTIRKRNCDGSDEILRALWRFRFNKESLRITGVNTDQCVAQTVNSLSDILQDSDIALVVDACNLERHLCSRNCTGLYAITRKQNVRIIYKPRGSRTYCKFGVRNK